MEAMFLICAATAITAFLWTVLVVIADYVIDPIVKRWRRG